MFGIVNCRGEWGQARKEGKQNGLVSQGPTLPLASWEMKKALKEMGISLFSSETKSIPQGLVTLS